MLEIVRSLVVWRTIEVVLEKRYYHWMFLSQPVDMPQTLINGNPVKFLHAALLGLSGRSDIFDPHALAEYERAAKNPNVVAAWCGDYTEGASTDLDHDRADMGRTSEIPCLVLWGRQGVVAHHVDPLITWQAWFPMAVGQAIDAVHFLVEEKPAQVLKSLEMHLSGIDTLISKAARQQAPNPPA